MPSLFIEVCQHSAVTGSLGIFLQHSFVFDVWTLAGSVSFILLDISWFTWGHCHLRWPSFSQALHVTDDLIFESIAYSKKEKKIHSCCSVEWLSGAKTNKQTKKRTASHSAFTSIYCRCGARRITEWKWIKNTYF